MTFFTVLWVTVLSGTYEGQRTGLVYGSLAACEAATSVVSRTLDYDHSMECEETATLSHSPRPRRRPEGLGE